MYMHTSRVEPGGGRTPPAQLTYTLRCGQRHAPAPMLHEHTRCLTLDHAHSYKRRGVHALQYPPGARDLRDVVMARTVQLSRGASQPAGRGWWTEPGRSWVEARAVDAEYGQMSSV